MPLKVPNIPQVPLKNGFARTFVKQMSNGGFLPVIALEAFVEAGRTYQAYKRGGFDEARERITEEFTGAIFWLGGVTGFNWLFEKLGQKILGLPSKTVDIASDAVRNPLDNYLAQELRKNGKPISKKMMAGFKFTKVLSSVLLANAFVGFLVPKFNQGITRRRHARMEQEQANNKSNNDTFILRPKMEEFGQKNNAANISFGGINLLSLANKLENERNWKLLSVDAGTCAGRTISARNNDERIEILFRDLSSIFFYMFNMPFMNKMLNKIEQNGVPTRLDPVSADYAASYMTEYLNIKEGNVASVEEFTKEFLGQEKEIPEAISSLFTESKKGVITLEEFTSGLKNVVSEAEYRELSAVAEKMSKLQPELGGKAILTQSQVKDIFTGGHINNPEFLKNFYNQKFGSKKLRNIISEKYRFIAQNDIEGVKGDLINFVNSVIESAKKTDAKQITKDLLKKASRNNLKMNAINWGTGFAVSALFLSTLIPKMQYLITKLRTGSSEFPGTQQYRDSEEKSA